MHMLNPLLKKYALANRINITLATQRDTSTGNTVRRLVKEVPVVETSLQKKLVLTEKQEENVSIGRAITRKHR